MANEIQVTVGLRCTNGNYKLTRNTETLQVDQTTASGGSPGVISVGTTEEAVAFGDVTPGYVLFKNLDATNYVQVGTRGAYSGRLLAGGGVALFYVDTGVSVFVKANTGACLVEITSVST